MSSFNEKIYLELYPHIISEISNGEFDSAFDHWDKIGKNDPLIRTAFPRVMIHQRQIQRLQEEAEKCSAQRDDLSRRVNELMCSINDYRSSMSWKLTKPLRIVSTPVFGIVASLKLVRRLIDVGGGVRKTILLVFSVLKREGLQGIRWRISNVRSVDSGSSQFHGIDGSYQNWISKYDSMTDEVRSAMCKRVSNFSYKPVISVLMPTYKPNLMWLSQAIESVRNQVYPYWELCIADDGSSDPAVVEFLKRYQALDARIKVEFRASNGHISAASNTALTLCSGEWIALMDHDDLLAENALFWVAVAINDNPAAMLIYSDEDKLDEAGVRRDPYFKPDWNPDLFYSQNLITHLGVYKTNRVKSIGGFTIGLEGAQDYDLALRYSEGICGNEIIHIPRILYHWRVHPQSTAQAGGDAKPYAMLAGQRALVNHFDRLKVRAEVEFIDYGYRIHYELPEKLPLVSLVIPTRNGLKLIQQCVNSILEKTTYGNFEIIVIDNGSDDKDALAYFQLLQGKGLATVIRDDGPFNYAALNNKAVQAARGELIGLLNNDLEVISPGWLDEMVSIALQKNVGAVGARLWYPDNTLQHGGVILGIGGWAGHSHKGFLKGSPGYVGRMSLISGFSAVTGACLVVRKDLYTKFGGLNEVDLKVSCNDVDLCLRLRESGLRNVWTPYAELYHHESATRGYEDTPEKKERFAREVAYMHKRWGDLFLHDPAYNDNLTLDNEGFGLAWPPRVELLG